MSGGGRGATIRPLRVVAGRSRLAHHAGVGALSHDDTIRNFFLRFSQAHIEAFWRPLWRWLLFFGEVSGCGLRAGSGFDGVFAARVNRRERARGSIPTQGRNSHHPLLAVLAGAVHLHGWLRSGNTGAARGVVPFLQEALALLPEGMWLRNGAGRQRIFDGTFLDFLEERALPYVVWRG